jgi:hypothetical protein
VALGMAVLVPVTSVGTAAAALIWVIAPGVIGFARVLRSEVRSA